jgi:transcription elongation factor SPT5
MATRNLNNVQFDDSDSEDDNFNPPPADMSDEENAGGDGDGSEALIRSRSARRQDTYGGDEGGPRKTNGKSRTNDQALDVENYEGIEDEGGEGEDIDGARLDGEEEDEDEEEVTVWPLPFPARSLGHSKIPSRFVDRYFRIHG